MSPKSESLLPQAAEPRSDQPTITTVQARHDYLRNRILRDHIERVLRKERSSTVLPQSLVLATVQPSASAEHAIPGGLMLEDLNALTPVPLPTPSPRFCQQLETELKRTLLSVYDYWHAEEREPESDEVSISDALELPTHIQERKALIEDHKETMEECRARVVQLVHRINKIQPVLESKLVEAIQTLPPEVHAKRAAQADVTAATIETALLKLSLVRTRAYQALYGHALPDRPDATVSRAIAAAYEQLRERENAQEAETQKLDRQIREYERMLKLVDGSDGSFAQVVRDMARVKKETEECRRDLRRLGWTGY